MPQSGVLLVGHGTRDRSGTEEFFELARKLTDVCRPRGLLVQPCLLEFQEPTIEQAWDLLVDAGVRHIHVAPLLLFAAGHARQDIPDEIAACVKRTPHVTWDQSRPISRHRDLIELLLRRIRQTCLANSVAFADAALVMVGRGNRNCCAQADMRVLTEVVSSRLDFGVHRTAFYAMAEPRLPDVLDHVAGWGRRHVVVQPHLLFQGRLYEAIERQVNEASERYPQTSFVLGDYLGPELAIANAVADRIVALSRES